LEWKTDLQFRLNKLIEQVLSETGPQKPSNSFLAAINRAWQYATAGKLQTQPVLSKIMYDGRLMEKEK
jgi:hypothetical protein